MILLSLVVLFAALSLFLWVQSGARVLADDCLQVERSLLSGGEADAALDALLHAWQSRRLAWRCVAIHGDIQAVEEALLDLKDRCEKRQTDEALLCLKRLRRAVEALADREKPSVQNIL